MCKYVSPGSERGRGGGSWLHRILFRIVNVLHRPRCPITYIFHVWNHACLLLQKGEGRHKGSNPDCSRTVCSPHEQKKKGLVSEPWARNAAPSAHRPGRGAAFLQTGVLSLLLPLPVLVVLLWSRRPLAPKSAFMENRLQIASSASPTTLNAAFLDLLSLRSG